MENDSGGIFAHTFRQVWLDDLFSGYEIREEKRILRDHVAQRLSKPALSAALESHRGRSTRPF